MSDQTVIEMVRHEIGAVPARAGHLEAVIRRGKRRRFRYRAMTSSAAALGAAALVGGMLFAVRPMADPVASNGALELVDGFSVAVGAEVADYDGFSVYQAEPAPAVPGGVDLGELGTEIEIQPHRAADFVVPYSDNPRNGLQAHRIVYLGDLEGAQVALHDFEGKLCVYLGNRTNTTGSGGCATDQGLVGGDTVDPPVGEWLAWTHLPESARVVTAQTPDGVRYWQRVTANTAVFITPDGVTVDPTTLVALGDTGTTVATTAGMELDLAEIGFPPAGLECPPESNGGPVPEDC